MAGIVIVSAVRTPIGAFNGSLASHPAHELGSVVIAEALKRAGVDGEDVSDVIMGQVLTAGCGQNTARLAAMGAGVPAERTALTINQVCGSGLRAAAFGAQAITCGDADIVVAGGQENMSLSPHCIHLRGGVGMGNAEMTDTMIVDGLWDAFNDYHMGVTAENVAEQWEISRGEQDAFACESQKKAEAAQRTGRFNEEIVPVSVKTRKGEEAFKADEHPKYGTTVEALSKLPPAFVKDGTVTAGNASGLNDGAAAVVLMTAEAAKEREIEPMARIASWASCGVDPALMGSGPIPASRAALGKAGWKTGDLDLIEINEAFAAQALAVNLEMGWPEDLVNVNGGATSKRAWRPCASAAAWASPSASSAAPCVERGPLR